MSLLGSLCVTLDFAQHTDILTSVDAVGDGCILLAACMYAIATVRLSAFVKDFDPTQLAIGGSFVTLSCTALWLSADIAGQPPVASSLSAPSL